MAGPAATARAGGRARLRRVSSQAAGAQGASMSSLPMTFAQRWETAVRTSGERPFLVFEGPDRSVSQWTYRQFDEVVTRMGATLAAAGVTPGSSVHVVLRKCPAFTAIWLACARWGAWLVPVAPTSPARDIGRQLDRVRPAVGICAASRADVYAAGAKESAA